MKIKNSAYFIVIYLFLLLGNLKAEASIKIEKGFHICNKTGEQISVAIAYYQQDNRWDTKGWLNLTDGKCNIIHDSLNNTRFYLYALSRESNKQWAANHNFCVSNRPFWLKYANQTRGCRNIKSFFSVWIPDKTGQISKPYYVYTFTPNNNNLNHPRAER